MHKQKNAGFSLVELIVVIALIGIVSAVASGSVVSADRARAKKATNTLSAMISQCKINALSGKGNELRLHYDPAQKYYLCTLTDDGGNTYKTEQLGNDAVSVSADSFSLREYDLVLRFVIANGAIQTAKAVRPGGNEGDDLLEDGLVTLTLSGFRTCAITLYKATGAQTVS